jgi:hypothetical protein
MQEQDTCRKLTFHTTNSNGQVHKELLSGSEIQWKKTEGNERLLKSEVTVAGLGTWRAEVEQDKAHDRL